MFRKALSYGGTVLLAGAALFAMPDFGWARGGGHGGGHFGGSRVGGAHFSGGRFGGAHLGGSRSSFYRGGYYHGYRRYGPYYGLHGGHSYYNYYPYYYDNYLDPSPSFTDDSGYAGYSSAYNTGDTISTDPSYPYDDPRLQPDLRDSGPISLVAPEDTPDGPNADLATTSGAAPAGSDIARVTVTVPANASVWFDGLKTSSTGAVREFESPPLTPGSRYAYEIRSRWNDNGHETTQTQTVEVDAGSHVNVKFPITLKTANQASAAQ